MENPFATLNWTSLLVVPGMLLGYTVHELAHALAAYYLGDYSQVEEHRITLNPLEHISWFGALAFILLGIGWPKPMQVNPRHLKERHRDMFLIAICGPFASFTLTWLGFLVTLIMALTVRYASQATTETVFALFFSLDPAALPPNTEIQALTIAFTRYIAKASLALTVMSLLPIPGQDGFIIVSSLIALFRERNNPSRGKSASTGQPVMTVSQRQRRNTAADIHFKLGADYHAKEQYDDAIARYRQAISHDSSFGPAYINLGLAYTAKNDRVKAIQAFRAATQYADDQRSQAEAWHQLHELSEIIPVDPVQSQIEMAELGATPWTDTKPHPNWWGLGLGSGLIVLSALLFYGYLLARLTEILKS
jgi:Zn-dependent protease